MASACGPCGAALGAKAIARGAADSPLASNVLFHTVVKARWVKPNLVGCVAAACAAVLALGAPVPAERAPPASRAVVAGQADPVFDGAATRATELVELDARLVPALLAASVGQPVRVADWPVAPGERAGVELTRFDVYAEDARIYGFENGRAVEVPRSPLAFFAGRIAGGEERTLLVTLDPAERSLRAISLSGGRRTELRRVDSRTSVYRVADADAFLGTAERAVQHDFACGQEETPEQTFSPFESAPRQPVAAADDPTFLLSVGRTINTLHQATVAVDTDNEFFHGDGHSQ